MGALSLLVYFVAPYMVTFYLLLTIVALLYFSLERHYNYWKRRGVPYEKPDWFYGNLKSVGRTTTLREPIRDIYQKYKGKSQFAGFYLSLRPAVLLTDLDLIKQVLIKDFSNFAHRGAYYNEKDDPISAHLFNLDGPRWREMRQKLTPTFSSLKMNLMLPMVVEIAERFIEIIRKQVTLDKSLGEKTHEVEMKDLLARFTTDVIGSCAFGLDCNSLNDPETKFRVMGSRVFTDRRHGRLFFAFLQTYPNVGRFFHIKLARDEISSFFMQVVRETLDYRDKHQVKRNDFLNLLMELRDKKELGGLSFEQIAAQSFVFFLAGFETSSSTMGFALYELAVNPDIQERARNEVYSVLKKHNGQLNQEAVKDLSYIQQIFYETLRVYSIATITMRQTIEDYKLPGTDQIIKAGTPIIIPIDAIHYDADIYPEPEKFNPSRFTPEAIKERHAMSWLPFGAGPRNCIGLRFGEMQSVIGLAMLLKNFRFTKSKGMPIPLEMEKKSFVLSSKGGIILNVEPISTTL